MVAGREEVAEQATMAAEQEEVAEQEVGEDHRPSRQRKPSKTMKETEQAYEGSRVGGSGCPPSRRDGRGSSKTNRARRWRTAEQDGGGEPSRMVVVEAEKAVMMGLPTELVMEETEQAAMEDEDDDRAGRRWELSRVG
ncbi:hypothetical protein Dimus_003828 [Dionaea muscipula]